MKFVFRAENQKSIFIFGWIFNFWPEIKFYFPAGILISGPKTKCPKMRQNEAQKMIFRNGRRLFGPIFGFIFDPFTGHFELEKGSF